MGGEGGGIRGIGSDIGVSPIFFAVIFRNFFRRFNRFSRSLIFWILLFKNIQYLFRRKNSIPDFVFSIQQSGHSPICPIQFILFNGNPVKILHPRINYVRNPFHIFWTSSLFFKPLNCYVHYFLGRGGIGIGNGRVDFLSLTFLLLSLAAKPVPVAHPLTILFFSFLCI